MRDVVGHKQKKLIWLLSEKKEPQQICPRCKSELSKSTVFYGSYLICSDCGYIELTESSNIRPSIS